MSRNGATKNTGSNFCRRWPATPTRCWGNTPVSSIDTAAVLRVVEPIWLGKTETASRVRGRIEAVLDWATVRGHRNGDNPARWKGHLAGVLPAPGAVARRSHYPALPWAQVAAFMAELRAHEDIPARALAFTILTAARTGEVVGARWSEIDLETCTWVIPAARMKSRREHRVPLSPRAVELLSGLYREDGNSHLFIGERTRAGLGNMAMPDVLQQMARSDVTVHGFRSTFRDWAAETTIYPNHVVEQALAHTISNAVEAAYRRGDLFSQRMSLMSDWAAFLAKSPAEVVPLRPGPQEAAGRVEAVAAPNDTSGTTDRPVDLYLGGWGATERAAASEGHKSHRHRSPGVGARLRATRRVAVRPM